MSSSAYVDRPPYGCRFDAIGPFPPRYKKRKIGAGFVSIVLDKKPSRVGLLEAWEAKPSAGTEYTIPDMERASLELYLLQDTSLEKLERPLSRHATIFREQVHGREEQVDAGRRFYLKEREEIERDHPGEFVAVVDGQVFFDADFVRLRDLLFDRLVREDKYAFVTKVGSETIDEIPLGLSLVLDGEEDGV